MTTGSDRLYGRALEYLPGGNSRTTVFVPPHPPYAVRGEGCLIVDADGREQLDLIGNYTSLVHGHARPEIVAAAIAALQAGACFSLPTPHEVDLATELSRRLPAAEKWRFTNSGTEAVMTALRLARSVTGRELVLRFDGCYHGGYDGVLGADAPGVPRALADASVSVPFGDSEAVLSALDSRGDDVACVLFDAMPNRAGLVPATSGFVELLRAETSRHGILLILDEVITFRLAPGGIQSLYGLKPDITILGKVIGGGHPVGAVGGRADVMKRFDPRAHDRLAQGGTFSANPVTMRAGLTALELLTPTEIERINRLGDHLRHELADRGWDVAGQGSLLRIRTPDVSALWWDLYEQGVLIAANGLAAVSTAMDHAAIDRAIAAFGRVAPPPSPGRSD